MNRKGITPVIAVVLLLLITVGAVASAWGLYQQITSDQSQVDQLNAQKRASSTEFSFNSVVKDSDDDSTEIFIQNTGSRAVNLSKELELLYSPEGEQGYVSKNVINSSFPAWNASTDASNCFKPKDGLLEVGGSYDCDTEVSFPNATQTLGIKINYRNADNTEWTYECSPQTSGTTTC